jgi:FolB domain-containing protein
MDRILIRDLTVRCIIGVNEWERHKRQDLVINLAISADLRKAGESDRFEDAVDYVSIKERVVNMAEQSQYHLLEAMAEAIAEICLDNSAVTGVQVRVDKPGALRFARSVAVEITRERA